MARSDPRTPSSGSTARYAISPTRRSSVNETDCGSAAANSPPSRWHDLLGDLVPRQERAHQRQCGRHAQPGGPVVLHPDCRYDRVGSQNRREDRRELEAFRHYSSGASPTRSARRRRRRARPDREPRRGLAPTAQDVAGDDLGVGRVRPADADAHAREVRRAEARLQRLQPVVAGEAAADPRADVAERQVDLVVDGEHVVERPPCRRRAPGRPRGPASFM